MDKKEKKLPPPKSEQNKAEPADVAKNPPGKEPAAKTAPKEKAKPAPKTVAAAKPAPAAAKKAAAEKKEPPAPKVQKQQPPTEEAQTEVLQENPNENPPATAKEKPVLTDFQLNILKPVAVLCIICVVASFLLALTNAVTAPVILANTTKEAERARIALLPQATGFEEVDVPEDLKAVSAIYKASNDVGWVIQAQGRGYGGQVPALVAFDSTGAILGVTFSENSETVGLGQKVREEEFYSQFAGLNGENISTGQIDKIASATISTNAAIGAVNAAIEAYQRQAGGGAGPHPTTTEQVLQFLLPGQTLKPITLAAPGVQATAYVGEKQDFVIFGEKPNSKGVPVVAAVAISANGQILNLWLNTSGEGEGYGQTLATNQSYISSFVGQSSPAQVDAVADITGTSASVQSAVNSALNALPQAKEAA